MTIDTELGKITASKATLNSLSIVLDRSANYTDTMNYTETSNVYRRVSQKIYDELDAVRYYDGIRGRITYERILEDKKKENRKDKEK